MATKTKAAFTPVRNEAYHQAMVEIRRSSATSRHTLKARKGTRSARNGKAMREEY